MAERIKLNGVEYVPLEEFDEVRDARDRWRRTLAMAHMHLTFSEEDLALAVIARDTGDDIASARAVRDVVAWVRANPKPDVSGELDRIDRLTDTNRVDSRSL